MFFFPPKYRIIFFLLLADKSLIYSSQWIILLHVWEYRALSFITCSTSDFLFLLIHVCCASTVPFSALYFCYIYISFPAEDGRPLKILSRRQKTLNLAALRLLETWKIDKTGKRQCHCLSGSAFAPDSSCSFTAAAASVTRFPNSFLELWRNRTPTD